MKKFLSVFLCVLVLVSVFALGAAAEEVVRVDPTLEDAPSLRSAPSYEYVLPYSSATESAIVQYLVDGGFTASNPLVLSSSFYMVSNNPAQLVRGLYYSNNALYFLLDSGYRWINGESFVSNEFAFYDFMINSVGLPTSAFSTSSNGTVFSSALALSGSVFEVGGSLLTFITSSWLTVVALVAFVLVLGFGVIRKLVKGV